MRRSTTWGSVALAAFLWACGGASVDEPPGSQAGGSRAETDGLGGQGATTSSAGGSVAGGDGGGDGVASARLDGFADEVAAAICQNLFRCCATENVDAYLGGWANSDAALEDAGFPAIAPPNASVTSVAECSDLVSQMVAVAPFGDWIAAAKDGAVGFDTQALDACIAELDGAACGEEFTATLFDETCLGYGAPLNPQMRRIFVSSNTSGACSPIRDGSGARFFGTCDRTQSFCCYEKPSAPGGCAYPFEADGTPRTGTCVPAGQPGDPCSVGIDAVALCSNHAVCGSASGTCQTVIDEPLSPGAPCYDDEEDVTLGRCGAGYFCGDQDVCAQRKGDGELCWFGFECLGGTCDPAGTCASSTFCVAP